MNDVFQNQSLTPLGFTTPLSLHRLYCTPRKNWFNTDFVSAKFWTDANSLGSVLPRPAETIINKIMPSISTLGQATTGDFIFNDKIYLSRDIMLLNNVVQWFGSNVGQAFLLTNYPGLHIKFSEREFLQKYEYENVSKSLFQLFTDGLLPSSFKSTVKSNSLRQKMVTRRDQIVIEALMRWLGTQEGRDYVSRYNNYKIFSEKIGSQLSNLDRYKSCEVV